MPSGSSSLRGRVSLAIAGAAAVAATLTGGATVMLADTLMLRQEDARMRAAAAVLRGEIRDRRDEPVGTVADDENREIVPEGMRLALDRGSARLGGDPSLPRSREDGCDTITLANRSVRRCAVTERGDTVVIVIDAAPLRRAQGALGLAALLSAIAATLGALLASRNLSRSIVAPLESLGREVRAIDPDAPMATSLGSPSGHAELDELRAVLSELMVRLDRSVSQSRRFAADAAHELRTPFGAMRAELELALEAPEDVEGLRAACARVERSLTGLSALTERLLILASPLESVGDEAVLMAEVVEGAVGRLTAAQRARVRCALDGEGYVRGDATLLGVAIDNALSNALKFSGEAMVTVTVERAEGAVRTRVQDDGPGVAAEDVPRVFEAFYRAPESRSKGVAGSGVGLSLVAHVMRAHGGTVEFEPCARGASLVMTLRGWK